MCLCLCSGAATFEQRARAQFAFCHRDSVAFMPCSTYIDSAGIAGCVTLLSWWQLYDMCPVAFFVQFCGVRQFAQWLAFIRHGNSAFLPTQVLVVSIFFALTALCLTVLCSCCVGRRQRVGLRLAAHIAAWWCWLRCLSTRPTHYKD